MSLLKGIEELNPAQREAAMHDKGPLLVVAGAGSGKTKTLVYRVARLINDGVAPDRILLLTFTRKAAQEMVTRATQIMDHRCEQIMGGTFHSFANLVLRKYGRAIGLNENFTILDRGDAEDLISMIRKELNLHKMDKRFPKKRSIANIFGKMNNTDRSIESILSTDYPQFIGYASELQQIYTFYQAHKKQIQVVDYDDLLIRLLELLDDHPDVQKLLSERFDYIMVDEYQDTNSIQSEIVNALANDNNNVMAVGDDSQSIYSFRGANFRNIMNFPSLFPGAKVITLEENYRSTQPILDLTNAVINGAKEKYSKRLFTKNECHIKPTYVETDSENIQSRFICKKVLELREQDVPLSQIAVLIRSGWHSNDLEVELQAHGIPFMKYGGFKFVESAHVKDVISFLRTIYNPSDGIAWHRVLLLFEGIGAKGAADLMKHIQETHKNKTSMDLSKFKKRSYYSNVKELVSLIFSFTKTTKPSKAVSDILKFYKPLFQSNYDDYMKRATDLDSIKTIADRYTDLETFLSEMSLEPPEISQMDVDAKSSDNEKLILSTIHSSKGLEWHSVFLLSAVDGYLPSFQSLDDIAQIEEERRLMYVALTRAKQNLFIIKPHLEHNSGQSYYRFSGMSFSRISRFLSESDIIKRYADRFQFAEEPKYSL